MTVKILSAAFLALFLLFQNEAAAKVTLDYPGWIFEDKYVPGIPSKDIDEYKMELKEWSKACGIELMDSSLNYVSSNLDIGFIEDVTIDVDGYKATLFNADYPVSDQMRVFSFWKAFRKALNNGRLTILIE